QRPSARTPAALEQTGGLRGPSMPSPREQPSGKHPKGRRPEVMPGGWLWLVILVLLVGILYLALGFGSGGTIAYSDFLQLVDSGKVSKVTLVGNNRVVGEVKKDADLSKLSERLQKQIRNGKFTTLLPQGPEVVNTLVKELRTARVDFSQEEEHG